jgi:flagellar biogenesis protein FliO
MLGALAAVVLPIALAGWLLTRLQRRKPESDDARGKMPSDHGG